MKDIQTKQLGLIVTFVAFLIISMILIVSYLDDLSS